MARTYEVIVIGAGQNGLTGAGYLAAAGLKVLVLERYHAIGGMTLTEEVTGPGFWSDRYASGYQLANLSPVPVDFALHEHGLELIEPGLPYAHAFPGGRMIAVSRDLNQTIASIAQISATDSATCRRLFERYRTAQDQIVNGMFAPPPSLAAPSAAFQNDPGGLDDYRFSRHSVRAWCDEQFESAEVKSLFASVAAFVGAAPDDAGGAEMAWLVASLLQAAGNKYVKGGMNNLTRALASYLIAHGGEVRASAGVERILVTNGKATGVRLESGAEILTSGPVISATDPRQLVDRLLGPEAAGSELVAQARRYEWGDAAFIIFVALDGPVAYAAGPELGTAGHVHLTPAGIGAISQAFVECRNGTLPAAPVIVAWNDSAIDPSRVPAGKHLKKFVVLGVPDEIAGDATGRIAARAWEVAKDDYADYLIDLIAAHYLPDLKTKLRRRVAHSPRDLERAPRGAARGTIPRGAMSPDRIGSQRPTPELGAYRTPIPNVYRCDSSTHPGPGVSMASGHNAARLICADLGLPFPGSAT
ncbi:MAG: NAD(P)/FAD-dependent oxidoreductase [Chloroflexota bacterium]|nr:NAD(P)/FAD-dependent oxidoreductase [Chloroflexota bacterium]